MTKTRRLLSGLTALGVVAGTVVAGSAGAYERPGTTSRIDVGPNGEQASVPATTVPCHIGYCGVASAISGNGRYVVFTSFASNIVPGDRDNGPDVFVRDLRTGVTTIASVSSSGQQQRWADLKTAMIVEVAISRDGRYVAFDSNSTTLVPGDTNVAPDVFLHDMKTATTTRVDVSSSGQQASAGSAVGLSMSADGRYVAFASASPDLVGGDSNGVTDVFVRDVSNQTTIRASVATSGAEGDDASGTSLSLSPTGRWLAFASDATNLVVGDTNSQRDVFVRDLPRHTTERISMRPDGSEVPALGGNSELSRGFGSSMSADGRYVVFNSNSMFLIPNDSNHQSSDWFVRDRVAGRTMRVSVASDGTDRAIPSTANAAITPDGRFVVFRTAENLVPADNGVCPDSLGGETDNDVYVHDMRTGATDLISQSSGGAHGSVSALDTPDGCQDSGGASISDDGRLVVFTSTASNLVPSDTNRIEDVFLRDRGRQLGVDGWVASEPSALPPPPSATCVQDVCLPPPPGRLAGARAVIRPALRDLYVDVAVPSLTADLYGVDLTAHGVQYEVRMQRGEFKVFRRTADSVWFFVASVTGGYGTIGNDVVAAVPLNVLGVARGEEIRDVTAFSGLGSVTTGVLRVLDELRLRGSG